MNTVDVCVVNFVDDWHTDYIAVLYPSFYSFSAE